MSRVLRVGFATLKGTCHVARDGVDLTLEGPAGDRAFALVDVARRRVLRTVENPALIRVVASWDGGVLTVTTPDGDLVSAPSGAALSAPLVADYWGRPATLELLDSPHAALLTAYLGRPVALARTGPGEVVYAEPVSIVTTGELRRLAARLAAAGLEVPDDLDVRFRATLTLDAPEDPPPGSRLRLGTAELVIGAPIERCAVVDIDPRTGARGSHVLPHLRGPDGRLTFGVGARVDRPGRVHRRSRAGRGRA